MSHVTAIQRYSMSPQNISSPVSPAVRPFLNWGDEYTQDEQSHGAEPGGILVLDCIAYALRFALTTSLVCADMAGLTVLWGSLLHYMNARYLTAMLPMTARQRGRRMGSNHSTEPAANRQTLIVLAPALCWP
jgi:hypothetical protein